MLISLTMDIISQCRYISKHHVHLINGFHKRKADSSRKIKIKRSHYQQIFTTERVKGSSSTKGEMMLDGNLDLPREMKGTRNVE